MRLCPRCGSRFEPPAQFCTRDGAKLVVEGPSSDPYVGTKILGQFRVDRIIGTGGMGTVYEALDESIGRRVAVKILHKDLMSNRDIAARFQREAQIASQLDHPNLVRLILFGQLPDGNLYLVLEYLDGPTFAKVLEEQAPLATERAVKIVAQIADAIGYVHRKGIVHRDLKPENVILIERDGDREFPKVLDFGIAKSLVDNNTMMTGTGLIFGTARYISPEGAQGEAVDRRSDVYSLGVIAYQALTGKTPFDAPEPMQLLLKHIHNAVPKMSQMLPVGVTVPDEIEAVVQRALLKNPEGRYDDASAFAQALREALARASNRSTHKVVTPTIQVAVLRPPTSESTTHATSTQSRSVAPPPVASIKTLVGTSPLVSASDGGAVLAFASTARSDDDPALARARAEAAALIARSANTGMPSASPLPPPAKKLAPRVQMSAIAIPTQQQEPTATHARSPTESASEIPTVRNAWMHGAKGAPSIEATESSPYEPPRPSVVDDLGDEDDFAIPGLPKKRDPSQTRRTIAIVLVTVFVTLGVGLASMWGMGMFPSQRRAKLVASMLRDAEAALRADRLVHGSEPNVEDLTSTILRLSPGNSRAQQLREAAAMRLRNRAVELRNASQVEQGLPLLRSALLLTPNNGELTELIALFEREVHERSLEPTPSTDAGVSQRSNTNPIVHSPPPNSGRVPSTRSTGYRGSTANTGMGQPSFTGNTGATGSTTTVSGGVTFTPGRDPNLDPIPNNGSHGNGSTAHTGSRTNGAHTVSAANSSNTGSTGNSSNTGSTGHSGSNTNPGNEQGTEF